MTPRWRNTSTGVTVSLTTRYCICDFSQDRSGSVLQGLRSGTASPDMMLLLLVLCRQQVPVVMTPSRSVLCT